MSEVGFQDVPQQIWSFALAVRDMGLGANISFGKVVCPPPYMPGDRVYGFKHGTGEGIVTVFPLLGLATEQELEVVRLARRHGFKVHPHLTDAPAEGDG